MANGASSSSDDESEAGDVGRVGCFIKNAEGGALVPGLE